ncbi:MULTISPECIES: alpha/beta hydrolase family protein [Deefgea]|uniref:Dienelactone hydrolase n=1 Tax=Deefgea chitinilytica TaxID=570276 RepID=A0ABS2CEU0_9NEIS|nr:MULTISPECIES: alpha/beta hydrolase [Deefgea]MBM5572673.1 dienelactone hydrolase [Deefgea chitinilytica]MBM9889909.1 alpha/beta hydrolase [Deefgea sp. CFH1-16]
MRFQDRRIQALFHAVCILVFASPLFAATGLTEIASTPQHGAVTVFYPAMGKNVSLNKLGLPVFASPNATPVKGNGRLIVMSHGSGGSPWDYADLASSLVEAGFVVALPDHRGDNHQNGQDAGPPSWKARPHEISSAIDAVAQDSRFAPTLKLDQVGMYGISAGGLTALTLAGGRWAPAKMVQHCNAHIRDDFNACAGTFFQLNGGMWDWLKIAIVKFILRWRFNDAQWQSHTDPRITAIVAGVPYGVVFDLNSLVQPKIPVALITARQDVWLHPQFHSDPIIRACQTCTVLHDFETGGHGALLSPIRSPLEGLVAQLVGDPIGFDRQETALVNQKISRYFQQRLLP